MMGWEIEGTDEFREWFGDLSEAEREDVIAVVDLLEARGTGLGFPCSSGIQGSRHAHMRELRIQHAGRPYRVLYAFDPRRSAILLLGGDKTGDDRWYERNVPLADHLYDDVSGRTERGGAALMARQSWKDIRSTASPETIERAGRKTEAMLAAMDLDELRKARRITQTELADRLNIRQGNVSRLERREDMHVSTLREVVEALGGELEITARFPDGQHVRIDRPVRQSNGR